MKKILKITTYIFSIMSLAVIVFLGGIVVRVTEKSSTNENEIKRLIPLLTFGLGAERASADVPYGSSSSSDCEGGGDEGC
ncbi:hypothetical protein A2935_04110 [Candidatus Wolfebacteria bacterium RIFCSPLOWO2_01_FULL_47_17b]|uniref:Uncharacterized protein n=1 Tax=Candidatus Wolfebacteria bacterium RIFCSPLOWO2_01_FULL_47_17b TaxID=1802558 RepID=A0A1F8DZ81_9BACT|nr:MAG: hypothetical protein A2935_04110 [Candidatus Wolfebacteria bacterium RIFCSPLOWO2_01_FULL_47_17b]